MSRTLLGKTFGEYTVIDSRVTYTPAGNPRTLLKVRCSCGEVYERERSSIVRAKHPMCANCRGTGGRAEEGYKHPLYRVWRGLVSRCYDHNAENYKYYGARGIVVCDRWLGNRKNGEVATTDGFKKFYSDMGLKPSTRHSLDRKNNDGPYSPENCRWATHEEQYANSRRTPAEMVTLGGHTKSVFAWCRLLDIKDGLVCRRVTQGQTPKEALLDVIGNFVLKRPDISP